jgi:hypothetical protein
MISAIHTALSGLTAFAKQIEVVAHNVANVNTDGFKKSKTEFVEIPNGGVLPVVEKDDATLAVIRPWSSSQTSIWVRRRCSRFWLNVALKRISKHYERETPCSAVSST